MAQDHEPRDGNARRQRLAEELRANLRRRKAQARARGGRDAAPGAAEDDAPEAPHGEE
jgi:hypothetical protein